MALAKEKKTQIIETHRKSEKDCGSPEVQVALLSEQISVLTKHFETHKKDNHSRRSLLRMVNHRRRLLDYLKRVEMSRYKTIIESLGLRK